MLWGVQYLVGGAAGSSVVCSSRASSRENVTGSSKSKDSWGLSSAALGHIALLHSVASTVDGWCALPVFLSFMSQKAPTT
jgi:hypothetical protein